MEKKKSNLNGNKYKSIENLNHLNKMAYKKKVDDGGDVGQWSKWKYYHSILSRLIQTA